MAGKKTKKTKSGKKLKRPQGRRSVYVRPETLDLASLEKSLRENPRDVSSALALAEHYYKTNQETRIIDTLNPLDSGKLQQGSPERLRFLTLSALANAFGGELIEAEKLIELSLSEYPNAIDFSYILSFVKLSLREYDEAIIAGQKYLSLLDIDPTQAGMPMPLCALMVHLSQLQNIIGNAYREKRQIQQAVTHYREAIEADPNNHLPYLNLATLYYHDKDVESAGAVIQKGLAACRQVQELRLLEKTIKSYRTVSACMIVKDEEELLPDCLDSVRHWVDEIIVVDTGSTDRTVEIAKSYGARIFEQEWEGDFSKHRNYSLEQATGDWIFVIDADERICEEDIPYLKELINSDQHSIISINVYNVYGESEEKTTFLPSVRLFRRDLNLRYEGIVHNRLNFPPDAALVRANVKLKHLGYDLPPELMRRKFERSKALLEDQLEANQEDAFALFNFAQLLRGAGKDNPEQYSYEIIKYASQVVDLTDPNELQTRNLHLMSLDQLAWAHFYKRDLRIALRFARRALSHKVKYLDPLLLLGHILTQAKKFDAATKSYLAYLEAQAHYDPTAEKDNIILVNPDSRSTALYGLAMLCELTGRKRDALDYYLKTAEINPSHLDVQKHILRLQSAGSESTGTLIQDTSTFEKTLDLGESLLDSNQIEDAELHFKRALELNPDGHLRIAEAYSARNSFETAIEYYKKDLKSRQSGPEILNDLANCYFKMKQYVQAEKYYRQAAEMEQAPALVFRNLGLTLVGLGKLSEAISSFEKYLKKTPDDRDISQLVADLYAQTGDFGSALTLYERSLMSQPDDSEVMFNLSECYLQMGHTDSARMGYERVLQLNSAFEPAQKRLEELQEAVSRA